MPMVQDLIDWLERTYKPTDEIAYTLWCVGDVMDIAKEEKVEMSEERAKEILSEIYRRHDANIGISWDVIRCYVLE